MEALRKFFNGKPGKGAAMLVLGGALFYMWFTMKASVALTDAASDSRHRLFICSETGRSFEQTLEAGMSIPIHSPHSGRNTGYPAERCFWTKDGTARKTATAVLLNELVGKKGPTFCPD